MISAFQSLGACALANHNEALYTHRAYEPRRGKQSKARQGKPILAQAMHNTLMKYFSSIGKSESRIKGRWPAVTLPSAQWRESASSAAMPSSPRIPIQSPTQNIWGPVAPLVFQGWHWLLLAAGCQCVSPGPGTSPPRACGGGHLMEHQISNSRADLASLV